MARRESAQDSGGKRSSFARGVLPRPHRLARSGPSRGSGRVWPNDDDGGSCSPNCPINFEKSYYSAPHRLVGQTLHVRATDTMVELYQDGQVLALHPIVTRPGQFRNTIRPTRWTTLRRRHSGVSESQPRPGLTAGSLCRSYLPTALPADSGPLRAL